jgi:Flp pilus assembly protein TadG
MMSAIARLRALAKDKRGVALVEFAFVFPVLLLMYLGGYQITDALSCNRKVTISARAVADLTTQNASVDTGRMGVILGAAGKVMAPYDVANAAVQVTEVYTDTSGNSKVVWSKNNQGTGLAAGTAYTLPTNIKINDSYVIVGSVVYSYTPAVTFGIVGPLTLGDVVYMNPRVSNSVDWKDS